MIRILKVLCLGLLLFGNMSVNAQDSRSKMIARAAELALKTAPYKAPPGDALSHHTSGFAKIMCSAVFITGLKPDFAAENVGYFSSPYAERAKVGKPIIDYNKKTVSITLPNSVTRTAIYTGDQGCVTLPEGRNSLYYKPIKVPRNLPNAATTPWPMGDVLPSNPTPSEIDMAKVEQAVNAAFDTADAQTAAFVVTYKGRIIGERYAEGITKDTPLESWSMGKSLSATILGILIRQGVYTLEQPAPIPQWQGKGDDRAKIRIMDIMHMSSGLYCRAPQDPDYDPALGYPDHLYLYTDAGNSFEYAANLPQQWLPNTIGRYRNSDPVLTNYLNRLGIEKLKRNYHTFPQQALFDKIGVRTMIMETDPYGNFLTQGYEFASGRDWTRLGNLYLQDGVWNGDRILPEGFTKFVSTLAEPWVADGRPIYGGLFWINGDAARPIPKDAYMMLGAGGQSVTIIPSHDLVVVRLGHYKGAKAGDIALNKAYSILMDAIPAKKK
ncbi:serine hydrolase domain-containing protein [Emticicia sp.]|uniref:serine hydrolase domain-containing protein n=1 Tax=Emticicia sp. TaxID=1930953 RepID=UPI003751C20E